MSVIPLDATTSCLVLVRGYRSPSVMALIIVVVTAAAVVESGTSDVAGLSVAASAP